MGASGACNLFIKLNSSFIKGHARVEEIASNSRKPKFGRETSHDIHGRAILTVKWQSVGGRIVTRP